MTLRRTFLRAITVAAALGAALAPSAFAAVDTKPHRGLQTLFDGYGDAGHGERWTGGPAVAAVTLPDGRTAWSMGRSYLGTVAKHHSRDAAAPMVNNAWVLQDRRNGKLTRTVLGASNTDFYASPLPKHWYEPGGAVVENGKLYQLLMLTADGNNATRVDVATIALPAFTLESITASKFVDTNTVQTGPQLYPTQWGGAVTQDAQYSYVFGYENTYAAFNGFTHLARIAKGAFASGSPEYWTGTGWDSTSPALSARLFGGADLGQQHFSVTRRGSGYRAITQGYLTSDLFYWTAPTIQGPWTAKFLMTIKREATEVAASCCALDFYPAEIPHYETKPSSIVFSYLDDGGPDHTSNVKKYRPVFIEGKISG